MPACSSTVVAGRRDTHRPRRYRPQTETITKGADVSQTASSDHTGKAQPCIITIFGATGDLTMRKLLPAIYNLTRDGLLHENTVVVGFARRPKTDEQFRAEMLDGVQKFSRTKPIDPG